MDHTTRYDTSSQPLETFTPVPGPSAVPRGAEQLSDGLAYDEDVRQDYVQKAIARSDGSDTLGYVMNARNSGFGRDIADVVSKMNREDYVGGTLAYQDLLRKVDAYAPSLTRVAGLSNAGKLGEDVAKKASEILNCSFGNLKVNVMGQEMTLREAAGENGAVAQGLYESASRKYGFNSDIMGMYFGRASAVPPSTGGEFDDLDARCMSTVLDPVFAEHTSEVTRSNAPAVKDRLQRKMLAYTVFDRRNDLREAFGQRASDVIDYVCRTRADSGGHVNVLESLIDVGMSMAGGPDSPERVAQKLLAMYDANATDVFSIRDQFGSLVGKKTGPRDLTVDQQLRYDSTIAAYARACRKEGRPMDLTSPLLRTAVSRKLDVESRYLDWGIDLHAVSKAENKDPFSEAEEYLSAVTNGREPPPGNLYMVADRFETQLRHNVRGHNDFDPALGDITTGREGVRKTSASRLGRAEGGVGGLQAVADLCTSMVLKEVIPTIAGHRDPGKQFDQQLRGLGYVNSVHKKLAGQLERVFSGSPARAQAASLLSRVMLTKIRDGEPVVVEDLLAKLSLGIGVRQIANSLGVDVDDAKEMAKAYSRLLATTTTDSEMKGVRETLVRRNKAAGMDDSSAQNAATAETSRILAIKHGGGAYRPVINRAVNSRFVYSRMPVTDKNGKPVLDPSGNVAQWQPVARDFRYVGDVFTDRYLTDPDFAADVDRRQALLAQQFKIEETNRGLAARYAAAHPDSE